ncbi:MAG: hypothetical protein ABIJ31_10110, partial [Pseudomonadota bacterium]
MTDPLGNIKETLYDMNGKVHQEKIHHKRPGGGLYVRTYVTYTHDNIGNILTATDASGTILYDYDALYRLTNVYYPGHDNPNNLSYTYDAVGNRKT